MRIRLVCAFSMLLTPLAWAQTFTVLHYFTGGADGGNPVAGLTIDQSGNLYGTTNYGGGSDCFDAGYSGCGVAFKLSLHGSTWLLTPLYEFQGGDDGAFPIADLTLASDGTIYGTTSAGGNQQCRGSGCGTAFHLRPGPHRCNAVICPWNETVLYRFTGGSDGGSPQSNLLFDSSGDLYGTTYQGGTSGGGVAFELTPSQGGWTESVINNFTGGGQGSAPQGNLIADGSGNFYGTTEIGGAGCGGDCGTVFQLAPSGAGWQENVLYSFLGGGDGDEPVGGVSMDAAGNLYGSNNAYGGVVFQLAHGSWDLTVLASGLGFSNLPAMTNPPVEDAAGNLYGTTVFGSDGGGGGCNYGCGVLFKLTPTGSGWTYSVLHEFNYYADGQAPAGRLAIDSRGNIYGTTAQGGTGNCNQLCGTVWEFTP